MDHGMVQQEILVSGNNLVDLAGRVIKQMPPLEGSHISGQLLLPVSELVEELRFAQTKLSALVEYVSKSIVEP